jgi:hypothetical protein
VSLTDAASAAVHFSGQLAHPFGQKRLKGPRLGCGPIILVITLAATTSRRCMNFVLSTTPAEGLVHSRQTGPPIGRGGDRVANDAVAT